MKEQNKIPEKELNKMNQTDNHPIRCRDHNMGGWDAQRTH